MSKILLRFLFIVISALVATHSAVAQEIYKHVDEKGKVTYSNEPPRKKVSGTDDKRSTKVTVAQPTKGIEPAGKTGLQSAQAIDAKNAARENVATKSKNEVAAAQSALEAAQKAKKDGAEPLEDEWQQARGARVPSEAFNKRQQQLDDAVKSAQKTLDDAQEGARRNAKE